MENFDYEMPTPCQHCGEIFELNDGFGSEKWYPNTVICEECYRKEEAEIEEDNRWEDINNEISNALYGLDKEESAWTKLTDDNRALILQLVMPRFSTDQLHIKRGARTLNVTGYVGIKNKPEAKITCVESWDDDGTGLYQESEDNQWATFYLRVEDIDPIIKKLLEIKGFLNGA
jgi:hypothetical protein